MLAFSCMHVYLVYSAAFAPPPLGYNGVVHLASEAVAYCAIVYCIPYHPFVVGCVLRIAYLYCVSPLIY